MIGRLSNSYSNLQQGWIICTSAFNDNTNED
jgi:hypothetical protein